MKFCDWLIRYVEFNDDCLWTFSFIRLPCISFGLPEKKIFKEKSTNHSNCFTPTHKSNEYTETTTKNIKNQKMTRRFTIIISLCLSSFQFISILILTFSKFTINIFYVGLLHLLHVVAIIRHLLFCSFFLFFFASILVDNIRFGSICKRKIIKYYILSAEMKMGSWSALLRYR